MNQRMYTSKLLPFLLIALMMLFLSGCGSSEPCDKCDATPTKAYQNEYTGEQEYYCKDCSSNCAFCSSEATEHYTSGLGIIIFACDECYAEILEMNS